MKFFRHRAEDGTSPLTDTANFVVDCYEVLHFTFKDSPRLTGINRSAENNFKPF